jgi:hypothetical protein
MNAPQTAEPPMLTPCSSSVCQIKKHPTKDLDCVMFLKDELRLPGVADGSDMAQTESDVWRCLDGSNDSMYSIEGLSDTFFEDNDLTSGKSVLKISSVFKMKAQSKGKGNKLVLNAGATIAISNSTKNWQSSAQQLRHPQRELYKKEGSPTILVVRVIDNTGDAPTKSASELSDEIFGTHGDPVNLVSKGGVDLFSRKDTSLR